MARRNREKERSDLPGQDSFLDIIANMVGILILLVVVVGIGAAAAPMLEEQPEEPVVEAKPLVTSEEVKEAQAAIVMSAKETIELSIKAKRMSANARQMDSDRERLATYVASTNEELQRRRQALDQESRDEYDLRVELAQAEEEHDKLTRTQVALISAPVEVTQLKNVPTPLAKKVEGDELMLRVEGGRVAIVPLEALISLFKQKRNTDMRRLRDRSNPIEQVGPVDGFQMFYSLVVKHATTSTGAIASFYDLVGEMRPTDSLQGESVDEALTPGSMLLKILSDRNPNKTSVTLWIYPGNSADVNRLREMLYEKGFATAIRPLPDGKQISFSPSGAASRAQ